MKFPGMADISRGRELGSNRTSETNLDAHNFYCWTKTCAAAALTRACPEFGPAWAGLTFVPHADWNPERSFEANE
jgi:hypothetical protein